MIKLIAMFVVVVVCSLPPKIVLDIIVDTGGDAFADYMVSLCAVMFSVIYVNALKVFSID